MEGPYLSPTLYEDAPNNTGAQEEVFGPVLSVITADSDDTAIKIANETDYGLTASVFSANTNRALRAARELRAGTITVNCFGEGDITTPFGGYKHSGFGGRDNGLYAHDQYCEVKTIWIDLSDANARDRFS